MRNLIVNKKGSEMIEAAVVLSLLLLTIMSIISFAIYSHETFKEQMDLQKALLFEAIEKYPGSVIIVSHEKDFYDGLVDYEMHF